MELVTGILGFFGLYIAYIVISRLFFSGVKAAAAGVKSVATGQSFSEAMGNIPPLAARLTDKTLDNKPDGLPYKSIEIKGLIPLMYETDLTVISSLLDFTDQDKPAPVLSILEQAQEENNRAFSVKMNLGSISSGQGFTDWVEVGRVPTPLLQSNFSGNRELKAIVRLVDSNNPPEIVLGFNSNSAGIVWQTAIGFNCNLSAKGYTEQSKERDKSQDLGLQLAVVIAMADGNLDDSEGNVIKNWMAKAIEHLSGERKETRKKDLNANLKQAYELSSEGKLALSPLVIEINKFADKNMKFEIMELCYDVMAADGVADPEEMLKLKQLGDSLSLDVDELEKLRDAKMVTLSAESAVETTLEQFLGIDEDWNNSEIRSYIRREYTKWNSRLNSLESGHEKEQAQLMLNKLGEARQKYG